MRGSSVLCSSMRPPWTLRSREKKSSSSMGPGALLRWSSSLPWACVEWKVGGIINTLCQSYSFIIYYLLCRMFCAMEMHWHFSNNSLYHDKASKQTHSDELTCVVRIILYRSSLGTGTGSRTGSGLFTKDSCLRLPLKLLAFDFGGEDFWSCALWSSSRRACAVATSSKNSSFCSEVMEEKTTVEK